MQLLRVKLVNFRQHVDTDIVLGHGVTAVVGPNGAGKSTLLEAIAWGFYGNPAARGTRDGIRWNRAPARAPVRVEVHFALGAHEFRVVRSLYGADLYQDRQDEPVATGHPTVTERVERILGMSRDEFFNTYFTGQKELAVMGALGPTDRARFLSRVLGYEKLRTVQDRLREERRQLRGELEGLERGLPETEALDREAAEAASRVERASAALAAATEGQGEAEAALGSQAPRWEAMVASREALLALDGERRIAERDVVEARREFERLDKALADALTAKRALTELGGQLERVPALKDEAERLDREAQAAGRRRVLTGQLGELAARVGSLEERVSRLADADSALEQARRALDAARQELKSAEAAEDEARTTWVRDRQDAQTKRDSLRDQYRTLQEQRDEVRAAGPDGACPVCKRPLGAVYEDMVGTLDRQLEEIEVQGKFFAARVTQLEDSPPEVREAAARTEDQAAAVERAVEDVARTEDRVREREETGRELEDVRRRRSALETELGALPDAYDAERHDTVRKELRALEPVLQRAMEFEVQARQAEPLVEEAERAEQRLSSCEARVAELDASIAALGFSEERFHEARTAYDAAVAAAKDAEVRLATVRGEVGSAEEAHTAIERRRQDRDRRIERIAEVQRALRLRDELDRALHDLRSELNTAMRPELSDRASAFLAALTDGRYSELELDEQYRILVIEDGTAKPVISGGEEDLSNLVLRLAISQMVAERAGQPLSLLVLDEIFGSLDEHRRRNVVELLRRLADRFPQVVLITHIESVKEGVDRVLRVELDEERGAAVVTEDEVVLGDGDVAA